MNETSRPTPLSRRASADRPGSSASVRTNGRACRSATGLAAALAATLISACNTAPTTSAVGPEKVRSLIVQQIPPSVEDRSGWALDIYAAFNALGLDPSSRNICAVLAVIDQESTYQADPKVPGLGRIAREEIDRRAERAGIPLILVQAALALHSPDSRTWNERIASVQTEKQLADVYEDFISEVPLGSRLLESHNPIRTGGPMQVSVDFAQAEVKKRPYPYRMAGSLRDEVFSRRGGVYFGIAHLLDYPVHYDRMLYRFADFNAGQYASRNAAFQSAVASLSGVGLDFDGDVLPRGADTRQALPGSTEAAVRSLGSRIGLDDEQIHEDLEQHATPSFEQTRVWTRVFELADAAAGHPVPRAILPRIRLHSPKITRPRTTEWYARRVDEHFQRCQRHGS